jgi:hypothetical protein
MPDYRTVEIRTQVVPSSASRQNLSGRQHMSHCSGIITGNMRLQPFSAHVTSKHGSTAAGRLQLVIPNKLSVKWSLQGSGMLCCRRMPHVVACPLTPRLLAIFGEKNY